MIRFEVEVQDLRRALIQLKRLGNKLKHREQLHRTMRNYQRKRWRDNLYNEGSIYGPWQELKESTNEIRAARGFREGHPILYQAPGGSRARPIKNMPNYLKRGRTSRGGMLHAWVKENVLADQFYEYGGANSTIWKFTASGGKDGSYAVYHDQGYTTGGMIPGKAVPARRIFWIDDEDEGFFERETEKYVDRVLSTVFA